jgi:DNA-binding response OmpR family regulator
MKYRVLLADDDPAVLAGLTDVLESEGYEVVHAPDGESAVANFKGAEIDIVLLDLNMPKKNGHAAFAEITAIDPLAPVIVLTASPKQYPAVPGASVAALIEKPPDIPLLLETMRELIRESGEMRIERLASYDSSLASDGQKFEESPAANATGAYETSSGRQHRAAQVMTGSALRRLLDAWSHCSAGEQRLFLEEIEAHEWARSFFL